MSIRRIQKLSSGKIPSTKLHCVVQNSFNYCLISIIYFVYLSHVTQSKMEVAI